MLYDIYPVCNDINHKPDKRFGIRVYKFVSKFIDLLRFITSGSFPNHTHQTYFRVQTDLTQPLLFS